MKCILQVQYSERDAEALLAAIGIAYVMRHLLTIGAAPLLKAIMPKEDVDALASACVLLSTGDRGPALNKIARQLKSFVAEANGLDPTTGEVLPSPSVPPDDKL